MPTLEDPDHDHGGFQRTMAHYYAFEPREHHRLNAWQRQTGPVDLVSRAGHRVNFEQLRASPEPYKMRHYHFLSIPHAVEKLVGRPYRQEELDRKWHGWRATLQPEMITLPSRDELRLYVSDDQLSHDDPWKVHHLGECVLRSEESSSRGRGV